MSENRLVQKGFETELNKNGFGFQFAVIKRIEELSHKSKTLKIYPLATEVPVEINDENTHIDIILKRVSSEYNLEIPIFLISECKRANPALSNWCFVKSPFTRNQGLENSLILEAIHWGANDGSKADEFRPNCKIVPTSRSDFYHISHEIRSHEKGDASGTVRGNIEKAVSQVFRGMNGFVNFMMKNSHLLRNEKITYFLPVIFTTAQIWTSEINLSEASIDEGKISIEDGNLERKNWVLFEYNQSPTLKHSFPIFPKQNDLALAIESEFSRTVAIVSASGIDDFIDWISNFILPKYQ